jgi:mutator protein MutT
MQVGSETIYAALRQRIELGVYAKDGHLPSEADLAKEFRFSRGTVRDALERLRREGFLSSSQGRRRQVRSPIRIEKLRIASFWRSGVKGASGRSVASASMGGYLASLGLNPTDTVVRYPERTLLDALQEQPRFDDPEIADRLGLRKNAPCLWFVRLRNAGTEPVALQHTVVPASLVAEIPSASLVPGGFTAHLRTLGIERASAESVYRPSRASREEARLLRIKAGDPLIEERRTSFFVDRMSGRLVPYEYGVMLSPERVAVTFSWDDRAAPPVSRDQMPKIAVRAIITNASDAVLVLRRKQGEPGGGRWCLPGGKLEVGESAEVAVAREVAEEVGVAVTASRLLFTQDSPPGKLREGHYLNIYFECAIEGEPRLADGDVELAWVTSTTLAQHRLVFGNDAALRRYLADRSGSLKKGSRR